MVSSTLEACKSGYSQWVCALAQTIQAGRLRKLRAQPQVLGLKDDLRSGCVKEHLTRLPPGHRKAERVGDIVELQVIVATAGLAIRRTREDR